MIGIESQPILRRGRVPLDGPDTWTGGTLFPQSSKILRYQRSEWTNTRCSGKPKWIRWFSVIATTNQNMVLSGRAVAIVIPIVFVVIGRYHGGAYVVFSKALNPNITAMAVKGSFASVIGGAPAAAVVFHEKFVSW